MSNSLSDPRDAYRIGDSIVCRHCRLPKHKDLFEPRSVVCRECVPDYLAAQRSVVTVEDTQKTTFQLALEAMQQSQTPAIPEGVAKARKILRGRTSTELLADSIRRTLKAKKLKLPINEKLLNQQLQMLQRAELEHDNALKGQKSTVEGMTTDQLNAIMVDRCVNEMIESKELRSKILKILVERVPTFYEEVLASAQVTVLEAHK